MNLHHSFVAGDPKRTVLLLHGTGGDEHDLIGLGREMAPGASLLLPRGAVLEGGMPRFFRRLAPGVFDEADLRVRTRDLANFVRDQVVVRGLDPATVWAVGYSNGANIAAAMMLLEPDVLAGAVLLRPVLPLEPDDLPDLSGRAAAIFAGRDDPWSEVARVDALEARLRQAGAEVTTTWRSTGHGLLREELAEAGSWLRSRL